LDFDLPLLSALKQFAITGGLYKEARMVHRALHPEERRLFYAHRSLLGSLVNPDDLVFDIGANIGNRTEILLSLGCRVVAFEPQPKCAREIKAHNSERLTVIQKAVGENEGKATLYKMKSSALSTLLSQWEGSEPDGTIIVEVTTLDKAIEQFGVPQFCKIDVEGFEPKVLRGLSHSVKIISLEYHCDEAGNARTLECLDLLSARGNYELNLTGEKEADFLSPQWLTMSQFRASFPGCAMGYPWGDIFAKRID
jgi:FkbM family methyltransferase